MEDDDKPESSSIADADRAARDTSDLDAVAASEPEGEVALESDGTGQDDGPSPDEPDTSVEAAADEEPSSETEVDPDDPATWPEDLRAVHEQYKGSPLELAKAVSEGKRTFKTELDKRLAAIEDERNASEAPEAAAAPAATPVHLSDPEYQESRRAMDALADRFDSDKANFDQATKDLTDNVKRLVQIDGLLEDIDAELKTTDDEYTTARLTEKRARLANEHVQRKDRLENLTDRRDRLQYRQEQDAAKYQDLKVKVGQIKGRARTVEETRRAEVQTFNRQTKEQESSISTSLDRVVAKLGVNESKAGRLKVKLLRALYGNPGDVADLDQFFYKEGLEEVRDWKDAQASTRVAYGDSKRRDVAQPAPAGVARPISGRPMTRRDADRIAMAAAKRIPL
jgi:predicted  nucleic acid-binding Zn-ribbon protein